MPGTTTNGTAPVTSEIKKPDEVKLFKHASRLEAGGALIQDVWSIFKYVPKDSFLETI
jgi:hypothetical protein